MGKRACNHSEITPYPGSAKAENIDIKINRWNDTSLKSDTTMRNGSMIVLKVGGGTHGYDSRSGSFNKKDCIILPFKLETNTSLISSISNNSLPVDNFVKI